MCFVSRPESLYDHMGTVDILPPEEKEKRRKTTQRNRPEHGTFQEQLQRNSFYSQTVVSLAPSSPYT